MFQGRHQQTVGQIEPIACRIPGRPLRPRSSDVRGMEVPEEYQHDHGKPCRTNYTRLENRIRRWASTQDQDCRPSNHGPPLCVPPSRAAHRLVYFCRSPSQCVVSCLIYGSIRQLLTGKCHRWRAQQCVACDFTPPTAHFRQQLTICILQFPPEPFLRVLRVLCGE